MPDYIVKVKPGETLADTDFAVSGQHSAGPPRQYYAIAMAYAKAHGCTNVNQLEVTSHFGTRYLRPVLNKQKASVNLQPTALTHHIFDNRGSDIDGLYSADLSDTLKTSMSVGWSASVTAGVAYTVGLEASMGPFKANNSLTLSLSTTVGKSASKQRAVEVGQKDGYRVTVPPGMIQMALLYAQVGQLAADVDLEWILTGHLAMRGPNLPFREVQAKDLQPYAHGYPYTLPDYPMHVQLDFAADWEIRAITIPDDDPSTVDDAIHDVMYPHEPARLPRR